MKIVEVNKLNSDSLSLVNNSNKELLKSFIDTDYSKDENTIFSCIIGLENNDIKNYSIFKGTRDTRFIQMIVENLSSKSFLEESINYAFKTLNAYTITIFTDKPSKLLEEEGFENLGNDNDIITYIKEKEFDKEIGRVRV